jgi:histidyl-tRNA synthetase
MGVERVTELMQLAGSVAPPAAPDVYLVAVGDGPARSALAVAEQLRDGLPGRTVQANLGGGNFKAQFRRADRSGARYAVVLGEDELARGVATVKALRREAAQSECPLPGLPELLRGLLATKED